MPAFSFDSLFGILAVVLVFGGLIFIHELGHFLAAKAFKVGVKTFSLGFGPKLWGVTRNNTLYQVAAFPLGGYVSMVGEADPEDIPAPFSLKDSFACRAAWQRLIIVAAGPVFNLVLAWLIYWGLFASLGQTYLLPQVGSIAEDSPAAQVLQVDDAILAANGRDIQRWDELVAMVSESEGRALELTVRRNGLIHTFTITPAPFVRKSIFGEEKTSWAIGIRPNPEQIGHHAFGFFASAGESLRHTWFMASLLGESIVKLFERVVPLETVSGPIRIVAEIHKQATSTGLTGVLFLAAFISLNLGLLNLLPIPVLDGGHIFFLLVETIRGRPMPEKFQEYSARVGIALLLCLMVFATYNDIAQWVTKGL